MTRRERLMASVRGEPVDRPPVSFYEINGYTENPANDEPFHIYNDPSWQPLLSLARDETDRIVMRGVPMRDAPPDPCDELTTSGGDWDGPESWFGTTAIRAGDRTLTTSTRRDRDVNTYWTTEHLLKDVDDFRAWLELPEAELGGTPDPTQVLADEEALGDTGIVMLETADPLCCVAPLFDMGTYTVVALTETALMHRALEKVARHLLVHVEAVSAALPGRLWRICGPEYATPPYLPPRLFDEYVVRYVTPIVEAIQRHGGYARIHCHGRLHDVLDMIAATGCTGLDPIEPPPQGDVTLAHVRERVGRQMTLFGNLEIADIENMPTERFAEKVRTALEEGTTGEGRGFVLMPSACPYGRKLAPRSLRNYEKIVELVEAF